VSTPFAVVVRNRDFRRLFMSQLVVFGGDWFVMVPLLVLLPKLTGNGLLAGITFATDTGIQALLLPYAGVFSDRFDRRKVMITANLAALLSVIPLLFIHSAGTAWLAPVAIGAMAVAKAFYSPASSAALPNVVDREDLSAANAVSGSAWGTMTVVGASLGGVLSAAFNPYTCFVITAVLLASAAVLTFGVRRPLQADLSTPVVRTRVFAAMREAGRFITQRPRVLSLVTVKSAVGVGNGVLALFPVLAAHSFGTGATGTGLLFASRGAGALVGPFLLRRVLKHPPWLMSGLAISMATYGLSYICVSIVPWFGLALVFVFLAHIAGGGNWMMSSYALQTEIPDELRGRVLSVDMMIASIAVAISSTTASVLESHISTRALIACCGSITLLYALIWRLVTLRLNAPKPSAVLADDTVYAQVAAD
jgi:MFS family permease